MKDTSVSKLGCQLSQMDCTVHFFLVHVHNIGNERRTSSAETRRSWQHRYVMSGPVRINVHSLFTQLTVQAGRE